MDGHVLVPAPRASDESSSYPGWPARSAERRNACALSIAGKFALELGAFGPAAIQRFVVRRAAS